MKRKTTKDFKNFKMDNEVYQLRKKVINIIYEVKNLGLNIPRVDVRIGEHKKCNVLGLARLKDNIIWITKSAISKGDEHLRHIVLHELLHTIYGCEHDSKCTLMNAYVPKILKSKKDLLSIFTKYYNKYNKIKQLEVENET